MTLHYPEDVCLPLPHPLTRMAVFMHHVESTNKTQPPNVILARHGRQRSRVFHNV